MTNLKTALILGTAVLFVAPFARAGDMSPTYDQAQADRVMTQNSTQIENFDNDSEVLTAVQKTVVLSSSATKSDDASLIPVTDETGKTFYNRVIRVEELPDPELDLSVINTVKISHEDKIYTNKVVQIEN